MCLHLSCIASTLMTSHKIKPPSSFCMPTTCAQLAKTQALEKLRRYSQMHSTQLHTYYTNNHLRANPAKTQVCAFHLKNRYPPRNLTSYGLASSSNTANIQCNSANMQCISANMQCICQHAVYLPTCSVPANMQCICQHAVYLVSH